MCFRYNQGQVQCSGMLLPLFLTPGALEYVSSPLAVLVGVQARLADRDVAIESGYALASLAAMAHDRILLGNSDDPPPLDAYPNTDDYDDIPSNFDDIAGGEPTGSTARMDAGQRRCVFAFASTLQLIFSFPPQHVYIKPFLAGYIRSHHYIALHIVRGRAC